MLWDFPTRLFHWLLAVSLVASWVTAEAGFEWTEWHFYLGYLALGLVLFRLIWGFVGSHYSRFQSFLRGPRAVLVSIRSLPSREQGNYQGHNPIGGWSVVVLLVLVSIQSVTGLFLTDDIFYAGPLNPLVASATASALAEIHHLNFRLLQAWAVLHIVAIGWYAWRKGANLLPAMWHGRGPAGLSERYVQSWWVAICAVLIAAGIVGAMLYFAPEPSYDEFVF